MPLTPLFLFSPARSGRHVATLGEGDDFGETALVGDGKRHASVVTAEPTTVLWMTKEAYEGRMKALREAEVALRVEFLQNVFLFSDWTRDSLHNLARMMVRHITHATQGTAPTPTCHVWALSTPQLTAVCTVRACVCAAGNTAVHDTGDGCKARRLE